jgi:hypothetical protein
MRRLFLCCLGSIGLYIALFGLLLERPLSIGLLQLELTQKMARLASMPSPKLVILAGSNGPYSHSCTVLGVMLALRCENAGIAVGIGLDVVFAREVKFLHRGDIVYMPMELRQYTASAQDYSAAPDAILLLRYDRSLLLEMPARRVLGAIFCCTLADLLESAAEMAMSHRQGLGPHALLTKEYNAEGDRIDAIPPGLPPGSVRLAPSAVDIKTGYGAALIAHFVAAETRQGVIVIGGMPTDFKSARIPDQTIAAVVAIYKVNGGAFLLLPNHSQYPEINFFNSEDHLSRPCQVAHSIRLGLALAAALSRAPQKPALADIQWAVACPAP